MGPNVVALEKRYGFPPRQFRLWIALHEVTHRAQFTGVPWLRPHFLSLVEPALAGVDPGPEALRSRPCAGPLAEVAGRAATRSTRAGCGVARPARAARGASTRSAA